MQFSGPFSKEVCRQCYIHAFYTTLPVSYVYCGLRILSELPYKQNKSHEPNLPFLRLFPQLNALPMCNAATFSHLVTPIYSQRIWQTNSYHSIYISPPVMLWRKYDFSPQCRQIFHLRQRFMNFPNSGYCVF